MEGPLHNKLRRWILSLQQFDFSIEYQKGTANANADALSRSHRGPEQLNVTATLLDTRKMNLQTTQLQDPSIAKIYGQLTSSSRCNV